MLVSLSRLHPYSGMSLFSLPRLPLEGIYVPEMNRSSIASRTMFEMNLQNLDDPRSWTKLRCRLDRHPLLGLIWQGNIFCGPDRGSHQSCKDQDPGDRLLERMVFFFHCIDEADVISD